MPSVRAPEQYQPDVVIAEGPSIFLDPSALGFLTGDVTVLARFVQFVRRDSFREHVPASRIEIRGSVDPEDETSQIVVRVWVRGLGDAEIRRYHSDLGARVDRWAARLPEAQRLHFISRISLQARREADA